MARTLDRLYLCAECKRQWEITIPAEGTHAVYCPACGSPMMHPLGESLDRKAIEGRGETHTPEHWANPRKP